MAIVFFCQSCRRAVRGRIGDGRQARPLQEVRPDHDDPPGRGARFDDIDARPGTRRGRSRRPRRLGRGLVDDVLAQGRDQRRGPGADHDRPDAGRVQEADEALPARRCRELEALRPGPAHARGARPAEAAGGRGPGALEGDARQDPEHLPYGPPGRLYHLGAVPDAHLPGRRGGESPPRAHGRDRRGPAQHRPARRRGRQPRRRAAPRRGEHRQDEEAAAAGHRAGPDDRTGPPGVHVHPRALPRQVHQGERRRSAPLRGEGPGPGDEGRGRARGRC